MTLAMACTPSFAADPVMEPQTWTGFYTGVNLGMGYATSDVAYVPNDATTTGFFEFGFQPPSEDLDRVGMLGGLQAGFNWQIHDHWVVGIEGDFQLTDLDSSEDGSAEGPPDRGIPQIVTAYAREELDSLGTARVRLGYLATDNLLIYGTGGLAFGKVSRNGEFAATAGGGLVQVNPPPTFICREDVTCFKGSESEWELGWTAGAGLEYAVSAKWTIGGEYLFSRLPGASITETALYPVPDTPAASFDAEFGDLDVQMVRFKLNYRFN
ncbi:MAG: porin family protein [Aestuariivirga sp.]|nr:porin family protein [Aestuariivirga sp.]